MKEYKYLGNGEFLPNVPARDLSEDELDEAGLELVLARPDLYQEVKSKSKSKPKKEDVDERIDEAQKDSAGS